MSPSISHQALSPGSQQDPGCGEGLEGSTARLLVGECQNSKSPV